MQNNKEIEIIYGGDHKKYHDEVVEMLENSGRKILSRTYAKGVKALIFSGAISVKDFSERKHYAEEIAGHPVAIYHLIDVWKYLKSQNIKSDSEQYIPEIHPIHKRVSIELVLNRDNSSKGYEAGSAFCFQGDKKRKQGCIEEAINLFDRARFNGYLTPYLYDCYAKAYRKLDDIDNEIDILSEAVSEMLRQGMEAKAISFEAQRRRAVAKMRKMPKRQP